MSGRYPAVRTAELNARKEIIKNISNNSSFRSKKVVTLVKFPVRTSRSVSTIVSLVNENYCMLMLSSWQNSKCMQPVFAWLFSRLHSAPKQESHIISSATQRSQRVPWLLILLSNEIQKIRKYTRPYVCFECIAQGRIFIF